MNDKVLIVDDEPIICKGISSKIDWGGLQLEQAGEAQNGMDALEMVHRIKPDIVITDIRMPLMDGLQFINLAKRNYPRLQFIIISGYSEFEYARQAIRYGVTDYLLKPVNKDELKDALFSVKERLKGQRGESADGRREIGRVLSKLLGNDVQEETRAAFDAMWRRGGDGGPAALAYTAVVYRLQDVKLPYRSFGEHEGELFDYAIRNLIVHSADAELQVLAFRQDESDGEWIAIHGYDARRAEWEGEAAVRRAASRALDAIRSCLGLEGSAGIGYAVREADLLKASYEAAVAAVRGEVLAGPGKVFAHQGKTRPADGKEPAPEPFFISGEQERLLLACLREQDGDRIRDWLEERYRELAASPSAGYEQFESLSLHIYTLLGKYGHEHHRKAASFAEAMQQFHSVLLSCRSWREMTAVLQQIAESILRAASDANAAKGGQIVENVKRYVESHYFEDVSLTWVAERFFIHPNYFSKLFKEKSGQNFNDYVTQVRLRRSLELMQDPNLGLTEIAALIGYDNYAYFSSVFRKWAGTSPRNYRHTHSGKPTP